VKFLLAVIISLTFLTSGVSASDLQTASSNSNEMQTWPNKPPTVLQAADGASMQTWPNKPPTVLQAADGASMQTWPNKPPTAA